MKKVAEHLSGYTYGDADVSLISLEDLENLKISVGWTEHDVDKMHRAWTKSLQLQVALWAQPYSNTEW